MSSCDDLLNEYFQWANDQDLKKGKCLVDCTMVATWPNAIVSFASGTLTFQPAEVAVDFVKTPASFSGTLTQVYSDELDGNNHPFDPNVSDTIGVRISGGTGPVVRLSAATFNATPLDDDNGAFSFELQCLAGVIYGVGATIDPEIPQALYTVSIGNRRYVENDQANI